MAASGASFLFWNFGARLARFAQRDCDRLFAALNFFAASRFQSAFFVFVHHAATVSGGSPGVVFFAVIVTLGHHSPEASVAILFPLMGEGAIVGTEG